MANLDVSAACKEIAARCRDCIAAADSVHKKHSGYVADLLEEIAVSQSPIDLAPIEDLIYSWPNGMTLSEVEQLALRTLRRAKPMFSVLCELGAKSPNLQASCRPALAADT